MRIGTAIGVLWVSLSAFCLAGDLENGVTFHDRKDYARAIIAFQHAAANGNAVAQRRLGFMYYHGEGVPQDNKRAVSFFEHAAKSGDIESVFNLAKMYEYGIGVGQDDQRAVTWYRKGAELGDPASQFEASVMYYKGQGVARDRIEAAKWWTLAMVNGGAFADRIRPEINSAEDKLKPEEIAEGKRLAAEWLKAHEATK